MYVGIDLGGTNIAAGIVDENGNVDKKLSIPTRASRPPIEIIKDMKEIVVKLLKMNNIKKDEIQGVGIGMPGLADEEGNAIFCVNLGWKNVPLKKTLEEMLDLPVYLDNDATVAAIAEYECGALKGAKNAVMLTLGTGVGGGIIIDGQIYSGSNGVGSELGHMIVGENFYDCNCGVNGCLETFASSTAIIKYTKKLLEETSDTLIMKRIEGNLDRLNAKVIFDCAKQGDEIAIKSVNRLVKYLSRGIYSIVNSIDPDIIALGGGVSKAGDYLLDLVNKEVAKIKYYKDLPMAKVVLAELSNDAGIVGAAMIAKNKLNNRI